MDSQHEQDINFAQECLDGNEAALKRLESEYFSRLYPLISRIDANENFVNEVVQQLRVRLLVSEKAQIPKLQTYSGFGSLAAWIGVIAVRIALELKRKSSNEFPTENYYLDEIIEDRKDPEMYVIDSTYRDDFRMAFRESLNSLTPRERNILRLRYIDAINIDNIGIIYRVSRSTIARWLSSARARIVEETRRRFQEKLHLSDSEMNSFFRLLSSDFELSASIILADTENDFSK